MKVLGHETVTRFHVRFSVEETAAMRACGDLPPVGLPEAELWITWQETSIMPDAHADVVSAYIAALEKSNVGEYEGLRL
jgi:hypothetical protein